MIRRAMLCAFAAAVIAAPAAIAQPSEQQLFAQGRAMLADQCSRCHQIGAAGRSPMAAAPPFHELMERYSAQDLEEALAEGLVIEHPAMPEFVFEPEEIAAIVAYLDTLRRR